jgi:hypothetical protein
VWDSPVSIPGAAIIYEGEDPALDRLVLKPFGAPEHATWQVVRYDAPLPAAHVALRTVNVPTAVMLLAGLTQTTSTDIAWFLPGEDSPESGEPVATTARIARWDDSGGDVEHDGVCYVVIHRTHAPGWTARINDGPDAPVLRVNGGLQAVRLSGSGRSRIALRYRPPRLALASMISLTALTITLLVLGLTRRIGQTRRT